MNSSADSDEHESSVAETFHESESSVAGRSMSLDEPHEEPPAPTLPTPAQPTVASPPVQLIPKLTRGMRLRSAISGYGVVVDNHRRNKLVFIIAVSPRNTGDMWRVFRRYSEFVHLREELIAQSFRCAPLPAVNVIGGSTAETIESRRIGLQHWLQSLIAAFSNAGREILDNMPLAKFLVTGANMAPAGFKLIKRVLEDPTRAASAAPSTTPAPMSAASMTAASMTAASMSAASSSAASSSSKATKGKQMTVEDFQLVKVVGKGSFGKVLLVRRKGAPRLYAMKVLFKKSIVERNQVAHTLTERRVLGRIDHPFIVKLHWAFPSEHRLHFVLDYCCGGELFFVLGRVGRLGEQLSSFYAAEITLALGYLHSLNIVYRDLKPENVLLDGEGHVSLADFGLSKEDISSGHKGAGSFCGTAEYLSPEVIKRQGHGTGVDWWALGMVLYEMMTGTPPWYTRERKELFQRVTAAPLKFPDHMSANACSIISEFLEKDPLKRLGVRGARSGEEVLLHPFFGHIDWKMLYRRQIPPPWKPRTDGGTSAVNFDKEFTSMPIDIPQKASLSKSATFAHFTFAKPDDDDENPTA